MPWSMSIGALAPRSGPVPRSERDARLDFFRGLALIFIFINHVPGNWLALLTSRNFGLSDAADAFVLIAGYTTFIAYSGKFDRAGFSAGVRTIGRRMRELYAAQLVLVALSASGLALAARHFENPLYFEHLNLTPFSYDPWGAIWRMLLLYHQLGYLNILPLYIVLLAWFPVLFWLMGRDLRLALGASLAIWLAALLCGLNLPSWPDNFGWYFNPLGWQLLFSLGAIAAAAAARGAVLPRSPWLLVPIVAYLAFNVVLMAPWAHALGMPGTRVLPQDLLGHVSKTNMSPWRLAHILCVAYVIAALIPRSADWLRAKPATLVINCGRNSLDIFCMATILSFCGFVLMLEAGRTLEYQIAVNLIGIGVMMCAATWLTHRKALRLAARKAAGDAGARPARADDPAV